MNESKTLTTYFLNKYQSQKHYINHLPVEELMTWPKHRINPFDTLDNYKSMMMTDEAAEVAIFGGVAYDTAD